MLTKEEEVAKLLGEKSLLNYLKQVIIHIHFLILVHHQHETAYLDHNRKEKAHKKANN